ncbi:hypothetical protein QAD02_022969 [Eretmocerus hayati]|uniref:Uncharacterized protein n=1 Tax=Eretmocerus hayati TaxID=131215 RepID=A0ACC2PU84_9HYME|nr:hypothetical protein QAD02_022969 [Eretmocerus hayati]
MSLSSPPQSARGMNGPTMGVLGQLMGSSAPPPPPMVPTPRQSYPSCKGSCCQPPPPHNMGYRPPPPTVPPPGMLKYDTSLHDKYKQPPPQYHQPGPNGALMHNGAVMGLQNPVTGAIPPGLGPSAYYGAQLARGDLTSDYGPDAKEPGSPMSLQQSKQAYMQKLAMQRLSVESHLREYATRYPGYKNHREYQEYVLRHREIIRLQQSMDPTNVMAPINLQFDQNGMLINSSLMAAYGPSAVQQSGIVMPNSLSPGKDAPPNPYDADDERSPIETINSPEPDDVPTIHIADSIDDPASALVKGAFHNVDSADMRSIEELVNKSADEALSPSRKSSSQIQQQKSQIKTDETLLPCSPVVVASSVPESTSKSDEDVTLRPSEVNLEESNTINPEPSSNHGNPNDELQPPTESTESKNDDLQPSRIFPVEDARCGNDELSLPDLPTSECTPMSTTLNTPSHSDNEESSEPITSTTTSTTTPIMTTTITKKLTEPFESVQHLDCDESRELNPIEINPSSPVISFADSPLNCQKNESDITAAEENEDDLNFDFPDIEQQQQQEQEQTPEQVKDTLGQDVQNQEQENNTSKTKGNNQQRGSLDLDSSDFGFPDFSNPSLMHLNEEPRMPAPPIENDSLTKIVKDGAAITSLQVLDTGDDFTDKVNDIWGGIRNLKENDLANSSNNKVLASEEKQVQTDRTRKARKGSLRHVRKRKNASGAINKPPTLDRPETDSTPCEREINEKQDGESGRYDERSLDKGLEVTPDQCERGDKNEENKQDSAQEEVLNLTVTPKETIPSVEHLEVDDQERESLGESLGALSDTVKSLKQDNSERSPDNDLNELGVERKGHNLINTPFQEMVQDEEQKQILVDKETGECETSISANSGIEVCNHDQIVDHQTCELDELNLTSGENQLMEHPTERTSEVDKEPAVRADTENFVNQSSDQVKISESTENTDNIDSVLIDKLSSYPKSSDSSRECRRSLDSVWQCLKPERTKNRAKSVELDKNVDGDEAEFLKEFKSLKRKRSIGQIQDEIEMLKSSIVELRNMNNSINDVTKSKTPPRNSDSPNSDYESKDTPLPTLSETQSSKSSKSVFSAALDENLGKSSEKYFEGVRNCVDSDIKIQLPSMNLQISDKQENCCERGASNPTEGIKIEINVSRVESQLSKDTQIISKSNQQLNISVPPDSPIHCKVNCTTSVSPSEDAKSKSNTFLEKVIGKGETSVEDDVLNLNSPSPDEVIKSCPKTNSNEKDIIIPVDDKTRETASTISPESPEIISRSDNKQVEIKNELLDESAPKEEDYDSIIKSFENFEHHAVQEPKHDDVPHKDLEMFQNSVPPNGFISSCSKDFDFDNYDFEPFKNKSNEQQSGSLSSQDNEYRRKSCNYLNPLLHLDELENLNAVPVYTTKDGKITYSPNPSYTYRALIIEARQREGHKLFKDYYDDKLEKRNRRYSSSRSRDDLSRYDYGKMRRSSYRKHSYESSRIQSNDDSVGFEDFEEGKVSKAKRDIDSEFEEIKPPTCDETDCKTDGDCVLNATRGRSSLDGQTRKTSENAVEGVEVPNSSNRKLFFDISLPSALSLPSDCDNKSLPPTEEISERARNNSLSEKTPNRCIFDLQHLKEDVLKKLSDLEARISEPDSHKRLCDLSEEIKQTDFSDKREQCDRNRNEESGMACDRSEMVNHVETQDCVSSVADLDHESEVCLTSGVDTVVNLDTKKTPERISEPSTSDVKDSQTHTVESLRNEAVISPTPTEMDMDSFVDDLLESCSNIQKIKEVSNHSEISGRVTQSDPRVMIRNSSRAMNLTDHIEHKSGSFNSLYVDNTFQNDCDVSGPTGRSLKPQSYNGGIFQCTGRFGQSELIRKTITALQSLERAGDTGDETTTTQLGQSDFEPNNSGQDRPISMKDGELALPNGGTVNSSQTTHMSEIGCIAEHPNQYNTPILTDGSIRTDLSAKCEDLNDMMTDNVETMLNNSDHMMRNGPQQVLSTDDDTDKRKLRNECGRDLQGSNDSDAVFSSPDHPNNFRPSYQGKFLKSPETTSNIRRKSSAPAARDLIPKSIDGLHPGRTERTFSLPCSIDTANFSFEICEQFIRREKLHSSQSDAVVKCIPKLVIRKSDTKPKLFAKSKSVETSSSGDVQKNAPDSPIKNNSTHPKIPKMIIRNVRSRPVTPGLDDCAENTCSSTNENEPKSLKVKIKLDEKTLDHVGHKLPNSNESLEVKIPKMKIKLEEKLPRVVIQSDEVNGVDHQKTIPKMKITNVKGNLPKIKEKRSVTAHISSSESSHKRHSSSSSSQSKKIRRSPKEERQADPIIEDMQFSPESDCKQKSPNSNSGSAASKIPKVIIKRTSPSAEFKCELSKEAIVNAQPQVVLTRLKKLDSMAQSIKSTDLEAIDGNCIPDDKLEDKLESNELQWKSFIRGLKRRRELSRSSSTSDLSRLSSPKLKRRRISDYTLDYQDSDSGTRLTFPAPSNSNDDGAEDEIAPSTTNPIDSDQDQLNTFASAKAYWRSLDENMNSRGKDGYEDSSALPDEDADRPDSGEPPFSSPKSLPEPSTLDLTTTNIEDKPQEETQDEAQADDVSQDKEVEEVKDVQEESEESSRIELLLLLDKDVDVHEEEIDGTLDSACGTTSVIKLDTSDESQTTIDILPVSPKQAEQQPPSQVESPAVQQEQTSNSGDGEQVVILTEDALPMHFEYELEVGESQDDDSLMVPMPVDEVDGSSGSDGHKQVHGILISEELVIEDDLSGNTMVEEPMETETSVDPEPPPTLDTDTIAENSISNSESAVTEDQPPPEEQVAKEASLIDDSTVTENVVPEVSIVMEPQVIEEQQQEVVAAVDESSCPVMETPEEACANLGLEIASNSNSDMLAKEVLAAKETLKKYLGTLSGLANGPTTRSRLKEKKRAGNCGIVDSNKAKLAKSKTKSSSLKHHNNSGSKGIPSTKSTKSNPVTTKTEKRSKSLTDQETANVIANISNLKLKSGKRPVEAVDVPAEGQADKSDEPAKAKTPRVCPEMGISKIVRELVFHDKATIRHRRYCMLCERWFPSTLRHRRHLAGYQHRHTELSQRKAIHMLFLLFTGKLCPKLLPPTVVRTDCVPGELTPLQIAVQDFAMVFDGVQQAVAKQSEEKES